ncbi:MAG: ABC transporter permease [Magnetococcales bacterium]|nr:ABC transporter permease [Magnetococcales bacterium]NGZ07214.1 ABC transporter permease [Magnetococcales bacterium]
MKSDLPTPPLEERRFSAQSRIRQPRGLLRSLWGDVRRSRELAWQLFIREIRQRYRQSILGFAWVLVPSLTTAAVFILLNAKNILNIEPTTIPYPIYVLLGTLLWQIFSESVLTPLKTFHACVPILTKINMPREAPILASLAQTTFFASVQLLPALGVMIWSGVVLTPALLLAPLTILMIILFGTAIGLFLVPLGALFHDVNEGSSYALKLAFFLTPIVYPPPQEWPWSLLVTLNPLLPLLQGARDLMATGSMHDPAGFWIASGGTVVLLLVALLFYRLAAPIVLERMGA